MNNFIHAVLENTKNVFVASLRASSLQEILLPGYFDANFAKKYQRREEAKDWETLASRRRELALFIRMRVKRVKSYYEPSGPSGRSLSPVSVAWSD